MVAPVRRVLLCWLYGPAAVSMEIGTQTDSLALQVRVSREPQRGRVTEE